MTTDPFAGLWRTSTRSANQGACVEVANTRAAVGVRDSKDPFGGRLTVTPIVWTAFTRRIKNGAFEE